MCWIRSDDCIFSVRNGWIRGHHIPWSAPVKSMAAHRQSYASMIPSSVGSIVHNIPVLLSCFTNSSSLCILSKIIHCYYKPLRLNIEEEEEEEEETVNE